MSSDKGVKSPLAVSPRFPAQRSSAQGESAPKARQRCVADGKLVNIPAPSYSAMGDGSRKVIRVLDVPVAALKMALRQIRARESRVWHERASLAK